MTTALPARLKHFLPAEPQPKSYPLRRARLIGGYCALTGALVVLAASHHALLGLTLLSMVLGIVAESGRRRAAARLEPALAAAAEANARLEKLDTEKTEFLNVAAHGLKNPLGIIIGFAELIASGRNGATPRDQEDARYIIAAADRMINLISELLDVNAIEQGLFPMEVTRCDLGVLSRQVTEGYADAAEKKGISIYAAGPLTPAEVLADPQAACRILDNLLSNAIKFSPPGGDVYVRIRNSPEGVTWEVQDQGAGLTGADMARLYGKFARLSARPTAGEPSTGLGLAMVKMLTDAMNGVIECKSKPGEGASFSVRLPAAPAEL